MQAEMPDEKWESWAGVLLGLPVEAQSALAEARAWVTWNLAGVITLLSLMSFLDLKTVVDAFGLKPAEALRLGGATFVTSFFIHGSFLHLVGNLAYLLVFGRRVEAILGVRRYLILITAAALGGGLVHVLTNPGSTVPLVGASGGISGVITLYALSFPDAQLHIFWIYRWFRIRAILALSFWIVLQLLGLVIQGFGLVAVSHAGHLGGFLTGTFLWWMWNRSAPSP
jgi:membrane associated rhomboid family serine protease